MGENKTFDEKIEDIAIEEIKREVKKWHSVWSKIKRFIKRI